MQTLRPNTFPPFFLSFKNHRSSIDQDRVRLNLTLPKPLGTPTWATLPTPPMSGSPPPHQPPEVPQIAGRRRKRSDSPTTAPATSTPTQTYDEQAPIIQGDFGGERPLVPVQPGGYATVYSQAPQYTYSAAPSMGIVTTSPPESRYAPGQVSPRTTRKAKAHVASACVNCKKKHLRCDNARPCRRCVQSGKEETCKDVEHKKRGRPPLRPDEPSRRALDPTLQPLVGHPSDPSRRMLTGEPSSYPQQSYDRPQMRHIQPHYPPAPMHMRTPQGYPGYGQPTVAPSPTTAMGSFVPPPRSYMSSPMPMAQPPPQYGGGYGYGMPQEQMGMPQQPYSNPIFPRDPLPPPQGSVMGMMGSSLQLPPIRPAPERSPIDPLLQQPRQSMQQQQPPLNPPGSSSTTRQPDPKRPKMDIEGILGPRHD